MGNNFLQKIGKYEVVAELGQGAMGTVFKAFDPFIKRDVAIKTINKSLIQSQDVNGEEILARFRREAQAAGRLSHPNIVSIYDYIENDDQAFIIMEIVNGRELKSFFDKNEKFVNIKDIEFLITQLLDALSHSHQNGVIHRDIKPANIIVMQDTQLKVTDFGIAGLESSELTQIGTLMGTPTYMSPEQVLGNKVDLHSDLFSAAVIFYQLLTGEKPFYAQSITAIMHKVLHESPIMPSILNPQLSVAIDHVLQKALSKSANDRYHSADSFKIAIKEALCTESTIFSDILPLSKDVSYENENTIFEDATSLLVCESEKTRLVDSRKLHTAVTADPIVQNSEPEKTILANIDRPNFPCSDVESSPLVSTLSSPKKRYPIYLFVLFGFILFATFFYYQHNKGALQSKYETEIKNTVQKQVLNIDSHHVGVSSQYVEVPSQLYKSSTTKEHLNSHIEFQEQFLTELWYKWSAPYFDNMDIPSLKSQFSVIHNNLPFFIYSSSNTHLKKNDVLSQGKITEQADIGIGTPSDILAQDKKIKKNEIHGVQLSANNQQTNLVEKDRCDKEFRKELNSKPSINKTEVTQDAIIQKTEDIMNIEQFIAELENQPESPKKNDEIIRKNNEVIKTSNKVITEINEPEQFLRELEKEAAE